MRNFLRTPHPRETGDRIPVGVVQQYIGTAAPTAWLLLNGDTIGSAASGATRAAENLETLYALFWDSMADAQAAVSTGRGASAAADFAANKTLTMPDARGRAVIGTGTGAGLTARTHGDGSLGSEDAIAVTHGHADTFTVDNESAHTHVITGDIGGAGGVTQPTFTTSGNNTDTSTSGTGSAHTHGMSGSVTSAGSSGTAANMPPILALNYIIKSLPSTPIRRSAQ